MNDPRTILGILCFFAMLASCNIGLPDVGGEGQPCSNDGTCLLGFSCVNDVCTSGDGDDDPNTDGDEDGVEEEEAAGATNYCDSNPCNADLHFRCDERADECVCDYGYLPDGEGNCDPACEVDTDCADQNKECHVSDGENGPLGEVYCGDCLAGYHSEDNECVADTSCLVNSCSQHGDCDLIEGAVVCNCDFGYVGDHCESCDAENNFVWDEDSEDCRMTSR